MDAALRASTATQAAPCCRAGIRGRPRRDLWLGVREHHLRPRLHVARSVQCEIVVVVNHRFLAVFGFVNSPARCSTPSFTGRPEMLLPPPPPAAAVCCLTRHPVSPRLGACCREDRRGVCPPSSSPQAPGHAAMPKTVRKPCSGENVPKAPLVMRHSTTGRGGRGEATVTRPSLHVSSAELGRHGSRPSTDDVVPRCRLPPATAEEEEKHQRGPARRGRLLVPLGRSRALGKRRPTHGVRRTRALRTERAKAGEGECKTRARSPDRASSLVGKSQERERVVDVRSFEVCAVCFADRRPHRRRRPKTRGPPVR